MRKYRVLLPLVLLALSIVTMGIGSDLYPGPAGNSWGDFKAYFQGQIASGTALPAIASATEGDLFILYSPTYAGDPKLYRQEWIMTESGVVASWALMAGGGSGSGVTDYSELTGRPTSASWTYSELSGNPTDASWTHDMLSSVTSSTGHDDRYARPGSVDPTYWQGPQVIGNPGSSLQIASGNAIIGLHDDVTDPPLDIRRADDTSSLRMMGGTTTGDGASIELSGQDANTGPKCAVTITAHSGTKELDGSINMRTYDTGQGEVIDRFQVGRSGVLRVVPIGLKTWDFNDNVYWDSDVGEARRGCLWFNSDDNYLYLTASVSSSVDWRPVGRAGGDSDIDFAAKTLTVASAVQGPKAMMTVEGGFASRMTAAEPLTKGYVVAASPIGSECVHLAPSSNYQGPIGVVYESVASGSAVWIIHAGMADVYCDAGATATNLLRTSATSGMAYADDNVPPTNQADHNGEIGHVLTSHSGAGLTRAILHFN